MMKLTLRNTSNLLIILTTICFVLLCVGAAIAEEISDFEKMLREALQNNRSNQTQKQNTNQNSEKIVPKPLPNTSRIATRNMLPSSPVADANPKNKEPLPVKSTANPTTNQNTTNFTAKSVAKSAPPEHANLNDGWVTLKPNEPTRPKNENGNGKPILVAEATKTGTPTIDPNASVWDAVPETVSQTPKTKTQGFEKPETFQNPQQNVTPTETDTDIAKPNPVIIQPSPSPWGVATDAKKTTSESADSIDWNLVANGNTEEEKNKAEKIAEQNVQDTDTTTSADKLNGKPEDATTSNQTTNDQATEKTPLPIGKRSTTNVDALDSSPVQNTETPETNTAETSEELPELTVPKSKTPVTVAEKIADKVEDKTEQSLNNDMDSILNALAKEGNSKREENTKSPPQNDNVKPEVSKNSDETANKTDLGDSASGKTSEKQSPAPAASPETTKPAPTESSSNESTKEPNSEKPDSEEVVVPDFDDEEDETEWKLVNPDLVGDPHSRDKIKLMYDEMVNGLKARNITNRYEMWKGYARSTLRSTAGLNTGSELDGRCRLSWYQQLYNEPIQSVFAVEEYSRKLHHALSRSHRHLAEIMPDIRKKMDIPERNNEGIRFLACETPFEAINEVKRCLLEAQMAHARTFSTLTTAEQSELIKNLIPTFVGTGCVNGHTIPNRTFGRRLTNLMEKMDKTGQYDAAEALIPLVNPGLLNLLDKLPEDALPTAMISGQKVQRLSTSAGDIIIGGHENNIYDLDSPELREVVCVIDLGGNDTYREGTCDLNRPVLAIIDLHGDDIYSGSRPGIQGGSVLGAAILIDVEGNDTYSAGDIAQGSTIGGSGMLFDFSGHDSYKGLRRVQGHALEGLGMLVDRKGNDKYRAAMWAQAFGAPGGFGILEDTEGNDSYYCGGLYLDSYPEHPGYDGWGQGVGAGIRQVANGGIGALLEGGGNDNYEVDYFGHGGGYWLGVGFVRDFGGDDVRHGCTLMSYSGGPRTQNRWTRFANGFGCHYSLGYCFDDNGDDTYGGTIMGTGMAWDLSIGYLCDFNGNNKFTATGGMTQGVGAEGSIGILFTYGGNDQFMGRNQAYASNNITYHLPSNCGGNFSFLINYGGNDKYGCGAANNSYVQRGSTGGFLIDRPTDLEAAEERKALQVLAEKRNQEIAEYDEAFKKATEEAASRGRRYVSRQRRPQPISLDQQRLSSVPHFENNAKTSTNTINIK
ncbi:MAG: hypothetical protein LBI18_11615, partial [Planctomycetaceae bacterium]|nr:hypothetical protein [Planctomycetaceae bacterium]